MLFEMVDQLSVVYDVPNIPPFKPMGIDFLLEYHRFLGPLSCSKGGNNCCGCTSTVAYKLGWVPLTRKDDVSSLFVTVYLQIWLIKLFLQYMDNSLLQKRLLHSMTRTMVTVMVKV